jgi:hypothetical protein
MIKNKVFNINEHNLPNANTPYTYLRQIILERSEINEHMNMLEQLLDAGAQVNGVSPEDNTSNIALLNKAIRNGNYTVASKLLSLLTKVHDFNINESDRFGMTPYMYLREIILERAETQDVHINILEQLIDAGANVVGETVDEKMNNINLLNKYLENKNYAIASKLLISLTKIVPWAHIYNIYVTAKKDKITAILQCFEKDKLIIAQKIQAKMGTMSCIDLTNAYIFLNDKKMSEFLQQIIEVIESIIDKIFSNPVTMPNESELVCLETFFNIKDGAPSFRTKIKQLTEALIGRCGIRLGLMMPAKIYARMKKLTSIYGGKRNKTRKHKT